MIVSNSNILKFDSIKFKRPLRECLNLNRVNSNTHERQNLQNNPEVFFGEFRQVSSVA